ncbi:MAG TPA: LOG family protein [Candidatus Nanoarchaeia archaeon]|nr:hypothetical protein [Nanoarchaeota archaeon]HLC54650.1 LOG family protein [Candidatus Nanoarchaeia archaeon]
MIVTIFGTGSPTKEGYAEAYNLGRILAKKGHTIKNGGYAGTMEASAKGCSEENGRAIGVCIEGHEISGDSDTPNKYLTQVIITKSIGERIEELLRTEVIIVLEGKIGTLEELFVAWVESLYKEAKGEKTTPIYIVGEKNRKLLNFLKTNNFIKPMYFKHVNYINSINELDFIK